MYNVRLNVYWPAPTGPANVQCSRSAASCYGALERCVNDLLRKVSMLKEPQENETTVICLTGFILPLARHDTEMEMRLDRFKESHLDRTAQEQDLQDMNAALSNPKISNQGGSKGG